MPTRSFCLSSKLRSMTFNHLLALSLLPSLHSVSLCFYDGMFYLYSFSIFPLYIFILSFIWKNAARSQRTVVLNRLDNKPKQYLDSHTIKISRSRLLPERQRVVLSEYWRSELRASTERVSVLTALRLLAIILVGGTNSVSRESQAAAFTEREGAKERALHKQSGGFSNEVKNKRKWERNLENKQTKRRTFLE